jgi:hypothetical protein
MAKENETPKTTNPAEDVIGPLVVSPSTSGYYTGVPEGYRPPSGQPPKEILDEKGRVQTRVYYDITKDANAILQTLSPKLRDQILTGLESKVSGYKKGTGFDDKDRSAFQNLLLFANLEGKPVLEAYNLFMKTVPNAQKVGGQQTIRVTSEDDIKAVFRRTANELLGRDLGDAEASKFAKMYQRMQVDVGRRNQAGGVVEQEPDAAVLAERQIESTMGAQTQAYRASQFMGVMDEAIKKLGV